MAHTVTVQKVFDGNFKAVFNVQGDVTAGGGTAIVVDKSTLVGPLEGLEPGHLTVEDIEFAVEEDVALAHIDFNFDRTTDVAIQRVAQTGKYCFRPFGGVSDTGTGGTGDIIAVAPSLAFSWSATLTIKKKA